MAATREQLQRRIDAALGRTPCDFILRNARYLDVFHCEWKKGDLAMADGVIVGLEAGLHARREVDARGRAVVPGFIDAHVHIESSMLTPLDFQRAILPRGTTSAICDPHELANVAGVAGIEYFLNAASELNLDLRVMLSSCVPATDMETNGAGHLRASALAPYITHPKARGLAEVMNVPGVLSLEPEMMEKLELFSAGRMDGHCPLLSGKELSAYASVGISSCHESTRLTEAQEKLTKGLSVWIREGSVAKDLKALAPLLNLATSTSVGFCTDDRNPLDIATEGHLDHLIRGAIGYGVASEVAYRSASWSVARHYGLQNKGAIAPGYAADLVLLDDAATCAVGGVWLGGVPIVELIERVSPQTVFENTIRAAIPQGVDLEGPSGRVHVIGIRPGQILTDHLIEDSRALGVARLSVLERYGRGSKPANGYVRGFGEGFQGAIASSVGHDSHNLIVVGSDVLSMRVALAALAESGGGFCVVKGSVVVAHLALPFGGLMTSAGIAPVEKGLRALRAASVAVGCELTEPFLQLAFLSLPVIASLKLTDKGLVDVEKFKIIPVRAA